MGLLNAVVEDETFGHIIDINVTDFSENATKTKIIFPKIVNKWTYTRKPQEAKQQKNKYLN